MRIGEEIQQEKFSNELHKAHINIVYTASWLNLHSTKLLKKYNISPQQFNILRILREMHPRPSTVKMLTERMLDKMSNASRLVEKLKQKGLVEREACHDDRRRVNVYITTQGIELLNRATVEMEKSVETSLAALSREEAAHLNQLLNKVRG